MDTTAGKDPAEGPKGPAMAETKNDIEAMRELFAGLQIEPSTEPLPKPSRSQPSLPNPFEGPLRASVEHGTPYSIHVPVPAVQRAVFLINGAARKANLGVRVVVNVQRDDRGAMVKGPDGKSVPVVEAKGENKGKVLIRFQGKAERKQQKAPRPFSIVKDPDNATGKALRERTTGQIVARGTHDEMRAELQRRKAETTTQPAA